MNNRDGLNIRGRLVCTFTNGFNTPSLTVTDPSVPYLPLETPTVPPVGGVRIVRLLMGVGISLLIAFGFN